MLDQQHFEDAVKFDKATELEKRAPGLIEAGVAGGACVHLPSICIQL